MKKIVASILLMLSFGLVLTAFSGCEKNDYQHPKYRTK